MNDVNEYHNQHLINITILYPGSELHISLPTKAAMYFSEQFKKISLRFPVVLSSHYLLQVNNNVLHFI